MIVHGMTSKASGTEVKRRRRMHAWECDDAAIATLPGGFYNYGVHVRAARASQRGKRVRKSGGKSQVVGERQNDGVSGSEVSDEGENERHLVVAADGDDVAVSDSADSGSQQDCVMNPLSASCDPLLQKQRSFDVREACLGSRVDPNAPHLVGLCLVRRVYALLRYLRWADVSRGAGVGVSAHAKRVVIGLKEVQRCIDMVRARRAAPSATRAVVLIVATDMWCTAPRKFLTKMRQLVDETHRVGCTAYASSVPIVYGAPGAVMKRALCLSNTHVNVVLVREPRDGARLCREVRFNAWCIFFFE